MYTYIIKSHNLYKIGKSSDVSKRMKSFRTANPLFDLIKVLEGDHESELHTKFKEKRSHLEWFILTEEDLKQITGTEVEMGKDICKPKDRIKEYRAKEDKVPKNFLGIPDEKWKAVMDMADRGYTPKDRIPLHTSSVEEILDTSKYNYGETYKWYNKYITEKISLEDYLEQVERIEGTPQKRRRQPKKEGDGIKITKKVQEEE